MDPGRWKRIDDIFHAALEREPSERAEFLAETCKEDDSLRLEVEALIRSHEKESSLFKYPATDLAAKLLAEEDSYKGSIAHYNILKKIGSGGMGEVYLAEDTRLHRKVALKLLPFEFTKDKERIQRFEREAQTVSALNHPYILTIYDVGQVDSSTFIASEYIDGETLRQKMHTPEMSVKEILNIAIQVAEALDAAHRAGIVHRDIKPENIMLRSDGYVKVLDFGLSKPIEIQSDSQNSNLETLSKTQSGVLIGTVRYMSPEQARGLDLDARSDIFSLGVVLYEMIAGRIPFDGSTSQDILVAIREKNPPTLRSNGQFPEELQWIIKKTLAKAPKERYQNAKDMIADLKQIRKKLELEEELKHSGTFAGTKRRVVVIAGIFIALSALVLFFMPRKHEDSTPPKPFSKIKLARLTSSGSVYGGVISPDGKYVAYVQASAPGEQSLYVKQLANNNETKILTLPPKTFFYRPRQRANALRFSPDGGNIYYLISSADKFTASLHRIPVLGGISQKLFEDLDMIPSFSPDGKNLAFVRTVKDETWVMTANADGRDQQKIKSEKTPPAYYEDIEWSPDGKLLASIKAIDAFDASSKVIVGIYLNDFSERTLFDPKLGSDIWNDDLQWLSDGSGLIVTKSVEGERQLFHIATSTGGTTRITNDLNDYSGVSLTRDNKGLITIQRIPNATIWTASSTRPNDMVQLTSGSIIEDGTRGISWTVEEQIVYESREPTGGFQLWLIGPDGANRKRITTEKSIKRFPVCSLDGRYIVYNSEDLESSKIWRMDSDGGNLKLLSGTKMARWPCISPDSRSVVYSTFAGKYNELLRVQLDGTPEISLASHNTIYGAAISPNGKYIAYVYIDPHKSSDLMMNIISFNGGASLKSFRLHKDTFPGRFHWTPDGSGIAYIQMEEGASNIYVQPVGGSRAYRLTNLTDDIIVNFSWSLDGKRIAYSRGKRRSDMVLIKNIP